jgi:hypothetical protein
MEEKMVKPIKPEEILEKKLEAIPAEMIQAVNELVALKWNGSSSTIRQDELLEKYFQISGQESNRSNREKVFDNHYLEFEQIYNQNGWEVEYNKPDYKASNNDFEPYFVFKIKK